MKAQEFLKQLKKLDAMITNKLIEKEQWKAIATGSSSISDSERVQTSGSQQKMADAVARYIDIENELDNIIDELIETKKDVISVIEKLNVTEYDILHKHYVQYMDLTDISIIYDKSYSWVTTKHGVALQHVQAILNERKVE